MAVCPIATTDATPAGLLQAYSGEDEEFYGLDEEVSEISSNEQSCSDLDELSDCDLDSKALRHLFNSQEDSDEMLIGDQDAERKFVRDNLQRGCGCSFNCYEQFSVEDVIHIRF